MENQRKILIGIGENSIDGLTESLPHKAKSDCKKKCQTV